MGEGVLEHSGKASAAQRAAEANVRDMIISKLRTSPAHGVSGNESAFTEWLELGRLLSTVSPLADMAAGTVKRRIAKALAASPDGDQDDIDSTTERVYWYICARAVDDWKNRSADDAEDDEEPGDLNLEILHVRPAEPSSREVDMAFLNAMVNGGINLLDRDLVNKLEPMFEQYASDTSMMDLLNRAANAYSDAAVVIALRYLTTQGKSPQYA